MTPAERANLEYTYQRLASLMDSGDIRQAEMDELYRIDDLLRPIWTQEQADYEQQMADAPKGYQFGDVGARAGNETLAAAGDVLANAGNVTRAALPESMQPYLSPAWGRIPDIGLAGLLGLVGGVEKGVGYGAEVLDAGARGIMDMLGVTPRYAPGTGAEVLAGDILGGLEVTGVGPEARAFGALRKAAMTDARGKIASTAKNFIADESGSVPVPGFRPPSAVSGLEQHAAGIVDLLRSGRADEITDAMLDLGDPVMNARLNEALWQNYDLPMDYASRMGRAEQMGFSDAYHGTGDDISAVDPSFFGNGQDLLGSGFYTTTNTSRAERYVPRAKTPGIELSKDYAEGGNVMPLAVREPNAFDLKEPLGAAAESIASSYAKDPAFTVQRMSSGAIHVSDINGNSVLLDPMQPRHWTLQNMRKAFGPSDASNVLSEIGYSGVAGPEAGGHTVRASYNPSDLRSRFARFDPRLAHLRNLNAALAGGAGIPIGLLAMQPNEEQY